MSSGSGSETFVDYSGGFGSVNKTFGRIFRYLLLAATLFGIVTVTILLLYVANDAIRPLTADPGWLLTFFVVFVIPTLGLNWYLARTRGDAQSFGVAVTGMVVVGLMFGAGISIVFVDVLSPLTWLAYAVALVIPLGAATGLTYYSHRLSFTVRFVATAALLVASLLFVPAVVTSLPIVPTGETIIALTIGGPIALFATRYATKRTENRRLGRTIGVGALAVSAISVFVVPLLGLSGVPGPLLVTIGIVPASVFAVTTVISQPSKRIGLSIPAVVFGGALLGAVLVNAFGFAGPQSWIDWQFLTATHSSYAQEAGFYPAIGGSVMILLIVALLSFPIGVGSAVYLEEYAPDNRLTRLIDVNISNLAGVPSVVYGLLGLGLFVTYLGRSQGTLLVGGAALALLILPIVIISSREAIRSVPDSMRQASYGMGATRWQTVRSVVLPRAFPGILSGTILALGRAIGETAPLIMIGAPSVFYNLPAELNDAVGAMPLQIYAWATLFASDGFYQRAVPAGVVVLLVVLLTMNSVAIALRNRFQ